MYIISILFLVFSLVFFLVFTIYLWSFKWPKYQGAIESFFLEELELNDKPIWKPKVKYSYKVDDKKIYSTRLSLFGSRMYKKKEEAELFDYSKGAKADVYVCPFTSNISFLIFEPRILWSMPVLIILSLAFYLLTLLYLK